MSCYISSEALYKLGLKVNITTMYIWRNVKYENAISKNLRLIRLKYQYFPKLFIVLSINYQLKWIIKNMLATHCTCISTSVPCNCSIQPSNIRANTSNLIFLRIKSFHDSWLNFEMQNVSIKFGHILNVNNTLCNVTIS